MAHVQFRTNYDARDIPIPTTKPPVGSMKRAKTLIRPERSVAPVPLITPPSNVSTSPTPGNPSVGAWVIFSRIITFWAPSFILKQFGGFKDKATMQAWREKLALCFIIFILCAVVGFATVGLQKVLCPQVSAINSRIYVRVGSVYGTLGVHGVLYNVTQAKDSDKINFDQLEKISGQDITPYFQRAASDFPLCRGINARVALDDPCSSMTPCALGPPNNATFRSLNIISTGKLVGYDWDQVSRLPSYIVVNGAVLNLTPYMKLHPSPIPSDKVDAAIRTIIGSASAKSGKDGTRLFYTRQDLRKVVPCLISRYTAGNIDKITPGCFASQLILYAGLIVILGLVLVRFSMACVFNWFLSEKLAGNPDSRLLNRSAVSPAVLPEGANISVDNRTGTAPWAGPGMRKLAKANNKSIRSFNSSSTTLHDPSPVMSLAKIGPQLFAVCLVTCYSESEDSLRTTLDSISLTNYSDSRKLLFVVADGMITGAGEKRSTPDICVSLLDADPRFGNPMPLSYTAVGTGAKRINRALVYAGHYTVAGRRTPTVIIVKCGTDAEALKDKKPGNRGKRDSQLILMNFFSRVTYNDRMTPLDFDLFRKIHILMGVTPDFFEVCLMVDADTKVFPESLRSLVNCMQADPLIMGVCGETRIANKRHTWVTAIQVFEYFISHHLAKAFESVFGGVSCLPGCFSMFRLKTRRTTGDDWIPLIIKPEIVKEYSQSEVATLHQKNLLLLGEDRFLTTILLRTFPNRKMMFLPQARCRTVVPDSFKVLLSQRRRWINSTIHNLMELVLVRNLCGTFCFSMQFVVFMDLLGTVVLPIAITLTYVLIVTMALNPPQTFEESIPLLLLIAVLGLPAVLILITTRKVVYVFWMIIYLFALPIWNFILPLYAFWHFDDFSWGETRKVEGETKDTGHGGGGGALKGEVPLRRWEDWERSRLRKLRREERRRRELERAHPGGFMTGESEHLSVFDPTRTFSTYEGSDTHSIISSEEDQWGLQIGGYNELHPSFPPPPLALLIPDEDRLIGAKTLGGQELEAILESGFDDTPEIPGPAAAYASRFRTNDSTVLPMNSYNDYAPLPTGSRSRPGGDGYGAVPILTDTGSPTSHNSGASSGFTPEWTHAKRRSGGRETYGPLGPLDPGGGRI